MKASDKPVCALIGKAKCLPVREAAKELGVTETTVREWIRVGKVAAVEKRLVVKCVLSGPGFQGGLRVTCSECGREFPAEKADLAIFCVRISSLKGAFDVKCRLCGKSFVAKHPLNARFCSPKHRNDWHLRELSRRRKLARQKQGLPAGTPPGRTRSLARSS